MGSTASSVLWASFVTLVLVFSCLVGYLFLGYYMFGALPLRESRPILGPFVETSSGRIEGLNVSRLGKNVHAFLGIPYAQPPVGELRFARPEPVNSWRNVLRATNQPAACLQFISNSIELPWNGNSEPVTQSEDCLRLNIWTPELGAVSKNSSRAVMVWIHGGGFVSGHISSPDFDGSVLAAATDSVVAMMNYRLGVFGFLNLGQGDIEGNMGMYDQVMALKWLKENAARFGGDPERITLFGESAGGASVGYHLLSPLSRDLFQRAIMQSGTALMPTTLVSMDQIHGLGYEIVASTGCNYTEDRDDIANCIKAQPSRVLLNIQGKIIQRKDDTTFCPSYHDEFLPQNPIDILREGDLGSTLDKEVLLGYNQDEGSVFVYFANPGKYPALTSEARPQNDVSMAEVVSFASNFMRSQNPTTTKSLLSTLYADVNETSAEQVFNATLVNVGEFFVVCPSIFMAEELANNNVSVFFYHFKHRPSSTAWAPWLGSAHYDEVQFVFGRPLISPAEYTSEEVALSKRIMRSWGTFARRGRPSLGQSLRTQSPLRASAMATELWPRFTERDPNYVEISAEVSEAKRTSGGPPQKRCNFWRLVYELTHSQLEKSTPSPEPGHEDESENSGSSYATTTSLNGDRDDDDVSAATVADIAEAPQ